MKKIILIITLIVTGLTVKAQDLQDIPTEVTSEFSEKFPGANLQEVDWDTEGINYKAEFSLEEKEYDALFDRKGNWISTQIEDVSIAEIPEDVQEGLNESKYSTWEVRDIETIENPDETMYKIEVRSGFLKDRELYFDGSGTLVREDS